jgi:hypothetical protein
MSMAAAGLVGEEAAKHPVTIILPTESLSLAPTLGVVPDTDGLILTGTQDHLSGGMEDDTGDIVEVTTEGVSLSGTAVIVSPEFHRAIIRVRNDQRLAGMELGTHHIMTMTS